MRKEELNEVKHACKRDRKYLKTNFTSETYSREEAINFLLLEYKFDHAFAVKAMKSVVVKEKINQQDILLKMKFLKNWKH